MEPDLTGRGFSVHEKEDMFSHLPVNVSEESFDIYDGLSNYFDDLVEFQGRKMKMEVSLVDVPPILQIQLQVLCHHLIQPWPILMQLTASPIQPRYSTAL